MCLATNTIGVDASRTPAARARGSDSGVETATTRTAPNPSN
jgi:hypothetical protein